MTTHFYIPLFPKVILVLLFLFIRNNFGTGRGGGAHSVANVPNANDVREDLV